MINPEMLIRILWEKNPFSVDSFHGANKTEAPENVSFSFSKLMIMVKL